MRADSQEVIVEESFRKAYFPSLKPQLARKRCKLCLIIYQWIKNDPF